MLYLEPFYMYNFITILLRYNDLLFGELALETKAFLDTTYIYMFRHPNLMEVYFLLNQRFSYQMF